MKKSILYMAAAALMILPLSCKKDDDETDSTPSLSGLTFSLDPYGGLDQTYTLKPSSVSTSDGTSPESVGYYWILNSGSRDTTDIYTFKPDTLGTYTFLCYAFAEGYYSTSASNSIRIVDPALGATVKNTGISTLDDHITTDGNDYYFKQAGGLDWFRNNLANPACGIPYLHSEITSAILGRYYSWEEAMSACPEGWRLPTAEEWMGVASQAGELMADAYFLEDRMWEYWPQVPITNATGLAVIPAGYAMTGFATPVFKGFEDYALFWTSTEAGDEQAVYCYLFEEDNDIHTAKGDKASLALSVRCVR